MCLYGFSLWNPWYYAASLQGLRRVPGRTTWRRGVNGRTGPISRFGTILPPAPPRASRTLLRARRHPRVAAPPPHLRIVLHGTVAVVMLALTLFGARFPAGTAPARSALLAPSFTLPGLAAPAPTATVTRLESPVVPLSAASLSVRQESSNGSTTSTTTFALGTAPTPTTGDTVAANRVQEQLPLFYRYEIQNGDTVSGIAQRF